MKQGLFASFLMVFFAVLGASNSSAQVETVTDTETINAVNQNQLKENRVVEIVFPPRVEIVFPPSEEKHLEKVYWEMRHLRNEYWYKSREFQEALAKEYLVKRYTVTSDAAEMMRVWGQEGLIETMSSETVYKKFWDTEVFNDARRLDVIKKIKEDGLTRTIDFIDFGLSSQQTNVNDEFYWDGRILVKSKSINSDVPDERKFCVWLRTSFSLKSSFRSKMTWGDLGFKVLDFAIIRLGEDGLCHWGKE